jgi:hypothetical protein
MFAIVTLHDPPYSPASDLALISQAPRCAYAQSNTAAQALPTAHDHAEYEIPWRPATLRPPGAQMAILEGLPSKPDFLSMRLKDARRLSPSGSFALATGTGHCALGNAISRLG